ncbi:putative SnoaL-like aldol condensation-catalyzing enzyme [Nocardioides thalensis]|uniref:Putative SnoaL-like aldol condensation-catalyzing enzyme n=1 Tax=Nocardioides thalensis TaxID=1914755 RepID=A0A853C842_9ACTN|nr:nuclear transport factor 2 family protein [Nocardioides thalensis]NYJ03186.1 putative SnoaL-like aldol condensation-catalyzing enzyme [Nocardioides thalensis]
MSNADLVRTAMHELFELKDLTALDRYWSEPYIQHSPGLPNGLDGLRTAVPHLEGFTWRPERVAEDGDLVWAHSRVTGWGEGTQIIVDIFRIHDGKIVEHWDVVQPETSAENTVNGNSML